MRTTLHPAGILLAHTLPAAALAVLYADALAVARPLLDAESLEAWRMMALGLAAPALAATLYAAWAWWRGTAVSALYGALAFVAYVPLLLLFGERMDHLFPSEVPRWMMPEDAPFYAFRLLAVPLVHALFVLVRTSLPDGAAQRPWRDLLLAAAIPIAVFLGFQLIAPFRAAGPFEGHAWAVVGAALVIGFHFLLLRGVLALVMRHGDRQGLAIAVRALVALVLPLLGLALNEGRFPAFFSHIHRPFGDLSHPGFWLAALLNAGAVLWPSSTQPAVRLIQFALRSAGFSYVLYFFVLFLPLLPLSVLAILFFGIGLLLLAPLLLFAVQARMLIADARFLLAHHQPLKLAAVFAAALGALPAVVTIAYLQHRTALHGALRHVFEADPSMPVRPIDAERLARALDQVEANRSGGSWSRTHTPFLTPFYNRIVLGSLTLSEERAAILRSVFLDARPAPPPARRNPPPGANTALADAVVESRYEEGQQAWRSLVHLGIRNTGAGQEEYTTAIRLPAGAWVTGHYLVIEGDTVPGLLAERRAAQWVYNSIVDVRRDPSLLRHTAPDCLELRVFPVEAGQRRASGIAVLHKEPIALSIGDTMLALGDTSHAALPADSAARAPGAAYLTAAAKRALPLVRRSPHVHLIVDGTEGQRGRRPEVIERLQAFVRAEGLDTARVTLHIADAYGTSLPYGKAALRAFSHHAGRGGCFTDRIIRRILVGACLQPGAEAPVIVLAPSVPPHDPASLGVLLEDLSAAAACLPEGDRFHVLGGSGYLSERRLHDPLRQVNTEPTGITVPPVHAWPDAQRPLGYLPASPGGGVLLDLPHAGRLNEALPTPWQQGLWMHARWQAHLLRSAQLPVAARELVGASFRAQVLLPVTAWICLENEAQRNALLKKQEELLNGAASLDAANEALTPMSEPGAGWMLIALLAAAAAILFRRAR
ncbi:MAG: MSEP-CTERM sorting domain-containing protein [Flavobacteriales bacterium]|nr:MAG: MSEP-CTERM sorting domain-containing protein [Flavobacteriales bacterium]